MPASAASRLARLRAHATGESHARAFQSIESLPPASPILAEPSPLQEQLEGAIFGKMNGLRFIPRQPNKHRFQPFGIRCVSPSPDRLVIELEEWSGYEEFVMNIMPSIEQVEDGSIPEIHGVPGLRRRAHGLGLSLFRPGREGEVILAGVSVSEWEAAHAAGFVPHHLASFPATSNPAVWTQAEQNHAQWMLDEFGSGSGKYEQNGHILQSAMLRRVGLLNRLGSQSITTWKKIDGIVIEVFQNEYNLDSHDSFIEEMMSPRMSPQLTCVDRRVSRNDSHRIIEFTTPRSEGAIEIRLRSARHPAKTLR